MFGVSSLGTVSVEEVSKFHHLQKCFSFIFIKIEVLNNSMLERAKAAKFDVLALTVDTITGGNRERDLKQGFVIPPRFTLNSFWNLF